MAALLAFRLNGRIVPGPRKGASWPNKQPITKEWVGITSGLKLRKQQEQEQELLQTQYLNPAIVVRH